MIKKYDLISIFNTIKTKEDNAFKKRAYQKAIESLLISDVKIIESIEDIKDLPGFGKGIIEKVQKVLDGEISFEMEDKLFKTFTDIHGIGPKKADELINKHNISSIESLRDNQNLLNDSQQLGLKYYEDFIEKIPRKEMIQHNNLIKRATKTFEDIISVDLVGSYRRMLDTSGDIDVIIQVKNTSKPHLLKEVVDSLINKGYVNEKYFALGDSKFLGICKLPKFDRNRRLDLLIVKEEQYPYALLYFTGSKEFNIEVRAEALRKGYSLNEYGLTNIKTKEHVVGLKTEKDVLKFIGFKICAPHKRTPELLKTCKYKIK